MHPPPLRHRTGGRAAYLAAALILPLALSSCGLLPAGVPAEPEDTSVPATSAPADLPSPSPAESSVTPSASATASRPTGFPSYAPPAEPPCALPEEAPDSVAGADGPTLTVKQVAKAWKASEEGKSNRVTSGTIGAKDWNRAPVSPGSALIEPGVRYAGVSHFEYTGLQTYVFTDPGRAAAKLAAVRLMVREPCSYDYTGFGDGPYVVVRLGDDAPDQVMVTGAMEGVPVRNIFVRYGNTVTNFSAIMMVVEPHDVVPMILDTLSKA